MTSVAVAGCGSDDGDTPGSVSAGPGGVGGAGGAGGGVAQAGASGHAGNAGHAGNGNAGTGGANGGHGGDAGHGGSNAGHGGSSAGQGGGGPGGVSGQGGASGSSGSAGVAGSGGFAGTAGSAGAGGNSGGGGSPALTIERWGARIWGPIFSVRRTDRELWIGTRAIIDPNDATTLHGGLLRLDLDAGTVKVFESELPQVKDPDTQLMGAVSTAAVLADGARRLVVSETGVIVIDGDTVTAHSIGQDATPVALAVDRDAGRKNLWVSTDLGLFLLDPDTFAMAKLYTPADLGDAQPMQLAVDPKTGAVYAGTIASDGTTKVVRVDDAGVTTMPAVAGATSRVGELVWSTSKNAALIALASYDETAPAVVAWDGASAPTTLATEGQLAAASHGKSAPFGTSVLAIDESAGVLVVGGRIVSTPPIGILEGGGLAFLELATGKLAGVSTSTSAIPGDHVVSLTFDPKTKRTHAALRQPCNDLQLGNVGVVSISFDAKGSPRFERPVLSGVRAFAATGGETYLGLRDDHPGLSCDGYAVQTGLTKLRAPHAGQVLPLAGTLTTDTILPNAGPTAIAATAPDHMAIGSWGDGTLVGDPTAGLAFNQTDVGVSLFTYSVVWKSDSSFFIAGSATHMNGDPDSLADVGPRGAALVTLAKDGTIASSTHYVRASKDSADIVGLPSSEVAAALSAPDGSTYLVCATERFRTPGSGDRGDRPVFEAMGAPRQGGLVSIANDGTMTVAIGSQDLPDPRAASFSTGGELFVLDAEKGLVLVDGTKATPSPLPLAPPPGAIPQSLWVGANGAIVAGYDRGAVVSLGGSSVLVDHVGYVWAVLPLDAEESVLLATDAGLVRVSLPTAAALTSPDLEPGAPPPYQ